MSIQRSTTVARLAALPTLLLASTAMAGTSLGGALLGIPVGTDLSAVLGVTVGSALPIGLGGAAVVTGLALVIGVQLIRRRGKK